MIMKPMSLYTPVEIAKGRLEDVANIRPYSIQKYQENPFQQSKTSVESLTDQKKKIIHWLRSMSIPQRKEKFAFVCKDFVSLLRVMCDRRRRLCDRSFRIIEQPDTHMLMVYGKENAYRVDNVDVDEAEEELIRNVMILSYKSQFDSVSLSERILANLQKLFEIFEILEDGVSNELSVEEYRLLEKEGSEAYFYRKDETDHYKKSLGKWLIEVLKKKLWCEYYKNLEQPTENKRTREKKRFNKTWKQLSPCQRRECMKFCSYSSICHLIDKDRLSERVRPDILPKVFLPVQEEVEKFMSELVLQGELDIYDYLSQCTLEEGNLPINLVKFPLLEHLKEYKRKITPIPSELKDPQTKKEAAFQASAQKKKKPKNKKKKVNTLSDQIQDQHKGISQIANAEVQEKIAPPIFVTSTKNDDRDKKQCKDDTKQRHKQVTKNEARFTKKPREKIDKQAPETSYNTTISNNNTVFGTPPQKPKRFRRNIELEEPLILKDKEKAKSITSNETNETVNNKQDELTEEELMSRHVLIESICLQKQRHDLVEVADSISQNANSYGPYRIVAFNRIQYLLSSWGISIKIFGSCATGLALANSDIDLAVDPSILNYFYAVFGSNKQKVCMALCSIMKILESRPWISNIKLITTATVPILKFEINPNLPFEESPKDGFLNTKEKQKSRQVLIKVDLTIESFYGVEDNNSINHLGIMATNSMKEWMSQYPALYTVSIVLKDLLKRRDLNNIYKGGISSYSLIIIIIAYMHLKKLTEEKNPAIVFYGFLEFLHSEFKHEKYGIDISATNPTFPFFQIDTPLPGKIQVKDPLNGKIVTCNSYQYQRILSEFRLLSQHRLRIQEDLEKHRQSHCLKASERGKYFSKNYLLQQFAET